MFLSLCKVYEPLNLTMILNHSIKHDEQYRAIWSNETKSLQQIPRQGTDNLTNSVPSAGWNPYNKCANRKTCWKFSKFTQRYFLALFDLICPSVQASFKNLGSSSITVSPSPSLTPQGMFFRNATEALTSWKCCAIAIVFWCKQLSWLVVEPYPSEKY